MLIHIVILDYLIPLKLSYMFSCLQKYNDRAMIGHLLITICKWPFLLVKKRKFMSAHWGGAHCSHIFTLVVRKFPLPFHAPPLPNSSVRLHGPPFLPYQSTFFPTRWSS